jgi:hypothetical protein
MKSSRRKTHTTPHDERGANGIGSKYKAGALITN